MWPRQQKPQHPAKLALFRQKLDSLTWDGDKKLDSLNRLFGEVDSLVQSEIEYYDGLRKARAKLSGLSRVVGWALATAGLLLPLISATEPSAAKSMLPWGYVLLAAAGSVFAGNALLGGSAGHIRFVVAQLTLERAMTEARIGWQAYMELISGKPLTEPAITGGFSLIKNYVDRLYTTALSETSEWAESTLRELEKYASSIAKTGSASAKSKPKVNSGPTPRGTRIEGKPQRNPAPPR